MRYWNIILIVYSLNLSAHNYRQISKWAIYLTVFGHTLNFSPLSLTNNLG